VDEKYGDALKVGIRYMYGFEFPCDVRNWDFGDISSLAEIGAVAEKHEIRGRVATNQTNGKPALQVGWLLR
jgi:hypothetical protein